MEILVLSKGVFSNRFPATTVVLSAERLLPAVDSRGRVTGLFCRQCRGVVLRHGFGADRGRRAAWWSGWLAGFTATCVYALSSVQPLEPQSGKAEPPPVLSAAGLRVEAGSLPEGFEMEDRLVEEGVPPRGGGRDAEKVATGYAVDVSYGPHPRNVLDIWVAGTPEHSPLVVFVHGGGFEAGDKSEFREEVLLAWLLEAGVSVAAINYRFLEHAPLNLILRDGARAVQFLRMNAGRLGVDPGRIAMVGRSAGAGIALWTAFNEDQADPCSFDPVLRHSSRLSCVVAIRPQASYDARVLERIMGSPPGRPLPGPEQYAVLEDVRGCPDLAERVMRDVSMIDHLSEGDPPVFLLNLDARGPARSLSHYKHHPDHVLALKERCEAMRVPCEAVLRNMPRGGPSPEERLFLFLLRHLDVSPPVDGMEKENGV